MKKLFVIPTIAMIMVFAVSINTVQAKGLWEDNNPIMGTIDTVRGGVYHLLNPIAQAFSGEDNDSRITDTARFPFEMLENFVCGFVGEDTGPVTDTGAINTGIESVPLIRGARDVGFAIVTGNLLEASSGVILIASASTAGIDIYHEMENEPQH